MTQHWLSTLTNGYLGSDYGHDLNAVLHSPMSARQAEQQISKLRADVPMLARPDVAEVNLYAVETAVDRQALLIEVAGNLIAFRG